TGGGTGDVETAITTATPAPGIGPAVDTANNSAVDTATNATVDATLPAPINVAAGAADVILSTGDSSAPAQVATAEQVRYTVALDGFGAVANRRFVERFNSLSVLRGAEGDLANGAQINRRISEDMALLNQLLRNQGYYDATLTNEVRRGVDGLTVAFAVQPGPRYTYERVTISGLAGIDAGEQARLRPMFGIDPGEYIITDSLLKGQATLESEMLESGYPFVDVGQELVTIDHDRRQGVLDQPISPGARLRYGSIIALDNGLLGAPHIQQIARFRPGEYYRQSQVEDLRRALIATGLIASVDVQPRANADGQSVDMAVNLTPAPLRTIAGALGYSSGEGVRAEVSWEHRNLFPPEGALIVRGVAGTQEQLASVTLRRNNYRVRDMVMTLQALASHQSREAYDARTTLLSARLEQTTTLIYQKLWSWSLSADLIATDELSYDATRGTDVRLAYFIGSLSGLVTYDRSNDLLDPTRGFRLSARLSPELSFRGQPFTYIRAQLDGSYYRPVSPRIVMAGRVRFGSLYGAPASAI
ncbi:MAG: autotransporter assembly complex protein TamA, partial [Sphingopyxis sp.]